MFKTLRLNSFNLRNIQLTCLNRVILKVLYGKIQKDSIVCWILNLLSETKMNYWFKDLLNSNISAILVAIIKLINISKEEQMRER